MIPAELYIYQTNTLIPQLRCSKTLAQGCSFHCLAGSEIGSATTILNDVRPVTVELGHFHLFSQIRRRVDSCLSR